MLARQLRSHLLAHRVHQATVHHAVRACEVDPLENTQGAFARFFAPEYLAMNLVLCDDYDFPGLKFANKIGLHVVQRARLGSEHPTVAFPLGKSTQTQRTNAQWIAGRDQGVRRE